MDISTIAKNIGPLMKRNSSTILTGLGVAASVGSMVTAIRATPEAQLKLDQAYLAKNQDELIAAIPLTPLEVVKVVWKDYTPAVGLQVLAVCSIVGAQSINLRRQAALISVVTISETAFREYQERMVHEAPTKDRKVRDDIAREKISDNPASESTTILVANGDQLFYDSYTDRYFQSTMQKVDSAVNQVNFRVNNQEGAGLNEFYSLVGLNRIPSGDDIGWSPESPLELDKSTHITDDDRPAVVISFVRNPSPHYFKGFR